MFEIGKKRKREKKTLQNEQILIVKQLSSDTCRRAAQAAPAFFLRISGSHDITIVKEPRYGGWEFW